MKKIYGFIALMMLLFVGNAQAQRAWDKVSEESVSEIKTDGTLYVLQEGFNTGGWSSNGYLNSGDGDVVAEINTASVYEFVATGDVKEAGGEEFPIYVLRNLENGKYLRVWNSEEGHYTRTLKNAMKFTARKAVEKPHDTSFAEGEEGWYEYSNAVSADRCAGAEAAGAWVLCSPESQYYISFGANPATWGYFDTSHWLIYEVKERPLSDYEKLNITYSELFPSGLNADDYPVGTEPGYINSQDLVDQFVAIVGEVEVALSNPNGGADFAALQAKLLETYKAVDEARIQVTDGYYYFIFQRSSDAMYQDKANVKATQSWAAPAEWTKAEAKYIWQVITPAKADAGRFYLRNFQTGDYMNNAPGTSQAWTMVADSTYTVAFPRVEGAYFILEAQNGNLGHVDGGYNVVTWNDKQAGGNRCLVYKVDPTVIESLQAEVKFEQDSLAMAALLADAYNAKEAFKIDTECQFSDAYSTAGLVTEFEGANATETREGSPASAFDGNLTTYYHTSWDANAAPQDDWHWVQVDLGKEVQHLFMKLSQRHNNRNGNPSRYSLVTYGEGEDPDAMQWTDSLVCNDTLIYGYSTNFAGNVLDSTTAIVRLDLGRPVQKLRFVVHRTKANQIYGFGPCWHVSELRFYEDRGDNPRYNMISEEVKAALDAAIAAAEAEVAAGAYTEETYKALEEAIEEYYEAYPDTTNLGNLLRDAAAQAEAADESEEALGYFQKGAAAELLAVVEEVKAIHEGDKILNKEEITALENKIKDAVKAFWGKLITPEGGKYYVLRSATTNENVYGSVIYAANSDVDYPIYWGEKDADATYQLNLAWRLDKKEDGTFALFNVGTGRYLKNICDVEDLDKVNLSKALTQSDVPSYFSFGYAGTPGQFVVQMADSRYLNTDPTQGLLVNWNALGGNSNFTFEEIESFEDGAGMNMVRATAGEYNIVTLPYAVTGLTDCYKIVGRIGNKLQLTSFEDSEEVPAGTPFIADLTEADAENNLFMFYLTTTPEELEYDFVAKQANGLVGCIYDTELQAGRGLFIDQQVMLSEEGDVAAAGTGYLCGDIPETEEEGELTFTLPEQLLTAIGNVTIERNEAKGVYTITGVKVRNSQMTKGALKNLPKGVYIIGSKKYIVK